MADPKPSQEGLTQLVRALKSTASKTRELEKADGTQLAGLVERVNEALENLSAEVQAAIEENSYTAAVIDGKLSGKSDTGHTHDASQIMSGTLGRPVASPTTVTSAGTASFGGATTVGGQLTANPGIRSTGARGNQVTNGYVACYIDENGDFGFAPSTMSTKRLIRNFVADFESWLTLIPKVFAYKDDPTNQEQAGLVAELVIKREPMLGIYDETGKLRGVRYELLGVVCLSLIQAHVAETRTFRDHVLERLTALEQ